MNFENSACLPSSLAVLGSTGSVGRQALDVAAFHGLRVDYITANASLDVLEEQVRRFRPRLCAVADEKAAAEFRVRIADTNTRVLVGAQGVLEGIALTDAPVAVNSILGQAGLAPTLAVIDAGRRLALVNKESLVIAGDEVMRRAKEKGIEILPVDSEHCAIFQCLQAGRKNEVRRLFLTASGGPFFGYTTEQLATVGRRETLAHPTWNMGAKITVDSATLMNKGFELIEAVRLFGVAPRDVEVVVQRQSIIHSMVEYIDNTVIAQLSVPDMRDCVQYALTYPARMPAPTEPLDFLKLAKITFDRPDGETFRLLPLAVEAVELGGGVPAALNAANEVAVAAFLADRIGLLDVMRTVEESVYAVADEAKKAGTLDEILACDKLARAVAKERLPH